MFEPRFIISKEIDKFGRITKRDSSFVTNSSLVLLNCGLSSTLFSGRPQTDCWRLYLRFIILFPIHIRSTKWPIHTVHVFLHLLLHSQHFTDGTLNSVCDRKSFQYSVHVLSIALYRFAVRNNTICQGTLSQGLWKVRDTIHTLCVESLKFFM